MVLVHNQVQRDIRVCGSVGVCAMTRASFLEAVFSLPTDFQSATVGFFGVPAVISAKEDPELETIFNSVTLAAMDGMPIVKLARSKGFECERCDGPSSMAAIFAESVKRGKTHYFYGGKDDEVLKKLRENLEKSYPGIRIVGMYSPPFRPLTEEEDRKVCQEINALQPDFLWVGIGAPKQERWMYEHRAKIHNAVILAVGAGFDFFAGTLKKSPEWISNAGFEWLYRLVREPKRLWRRYALGGVKYLYYSAEYRMKERKKSRAGQ